MDIGRKADIKELKKLKKTAPDKETLQNIKKVEKTIKDEQHDGWRRSARESMIREARQGRMKDARGIQEDLTKKYEKGGGIGKTSFSFNIPDHIK
jgi:hypothetical protein